MKHAEWIIQPPRSPPGYGSVSATDVGVGVGVGVGVCRTRNPWYNAIYRLGIDQQFLYMNEKYITSLK